MELNALQKIGLSKTGELKISYKEIIEKIFEPNVTELDDPNKVSASWGFKDNMGREAFIWAKGANGLYENVVDCDVFSITGNVDLLKEIFTDNVRFY